MTVRELFKMFDGYRYRLRQHVLPFALQSFIVQSMFSKDVTLDTTLKVFMGSVGLDTLES